MRISNQNIPDHKITLTSLTHIYGIGLRLSAKIIKKIENDLKQNLNRECNIKTKRVRDLTKEEIELLIGEIKNILTGEELKRFKKNIIDSEIAIGTYRASRRLRHLPVRQRTRHNARTAKGHKRMTVANKKKAPQQ